MRQLVTMYGMLTYEDGEYRFEKCVDVAEKLQKEDMNTTFNMQYPSVSFSKEFGLCALTYERLRKGNKWYEDKEWFIDIKDEIEQGYLENYKYTEFLLDKWSKDSLTTMYTLEKSKYVLVRKQRK